MALFLTTGRGGGRGWEVQWEGAQGRHSKANGSNRSFRCSGKESQVSSSIDNVYGPLYLCRSSSFLMFTQADAMFEEFSSTAMMIFDVFFRPGPVFNFWCCCVKYGKTVENPSQQLAFAGPTGRVSKKCSVQKNQLTQARTLSQVKHVRSVKQKSLALHKFSSSTLGVSCVQLQFSIRKYHFFSRELRAVKLATIAV